MIGKMAGVATFATGVITGETTVVKKPRAAQKMNSTVPHLLRQQWQLEKSQQIIHFQLIREN